MPYHKRLAGFCSGCAALAGLGLGFAQSASAQPYHAAPVVASVAATSVADSVAAIPASVPSTYTVVSGDTLSSIAQRYGTTWEQLAQINSLPDPNFIVVGQVLNLTGSETYSAPAQAPVEAPEAPAPVSAPTPTYSTPPAPANVTYQAPTYQAPANASGSGSSSMANCIMQNESNGNSQIMNSSGHYGLYQFSASTWAASGGNPSDFGNASTAEQNQVFNNAVSRYGYQPWTGDGCVG